MGHVLKRISHLKITSNFNCSKVLKYKKGSRRVCIEVLGSQGFWKGLDRTSEFWRVSEGSSVNRWVLKCSRRNYGNHSVLNGSWIYWKILLYLFFSQWRRLNYWVPYWALLYIIYKVGKVNLLDFFFFLLFVKQGYQNTSYTEMCDGCVLTH